MGLWHVQWPWSRKGGLLTGVSSFVGLAGRFPASTEVPHLVDFWKWMTSMFMGNQCCMCSTSIRSVRAPGKERSH